MGTFEYPIIYLLSVMLVQNVWGNLIFYLHRHHSHVSIQQKFPFRLIYGILWNSIAYSFRCMKMMKFIRSINTWIFFYIFLIATQTFSRYEVSFCSNSSSNEGAKWELNYTYMWKMRLCEKTLLIITPRAIHKHKKMFFSHLIALDSAVFVLQARCDFCDMMRKKTETLACIHVNNFSRDRQSTAKSHYEAYSWGKTMGIERWLRKKYDKVTCLTMLIDFGVLHL